MPRLTASKEDIKGLPPLPEGLYTFRCEGFKPKFSKDKNSINLNPIMKITNHATYNDRSVFENLNTKGKWVWKDFCHCFGVPLIEDGAGDFEFPGDFVGADDNPESWQYTGPLVGQIGQAYIVQKDDTKGGVANAVKFYVCKIALSGSCNEKHSQNLVK
jgi:hypothetical protein